MPDGMMKDVGPSLAEISAAWNLPPIVATLAPSTGTLHHVTLLIAHEAKYVLKAYRDAQKDRARMVAEHAVAAYVQAHGLPAIAPLALSSGETILEHNDRLYALYPFAHGQQLLREQVTSPEIIAAMGRCLAEVHQVLATYPQETVRRQSFSVDLSATFSKMAQIASAITQKARRDPFDQAILAMLQRRRDWLATAQTVDLIPFFSLQSQGLHGDYQETNLFFADGRVCAIIDWEKVCIAPRAWEVVRTLHYVFHLERSGCQTFLKAYREVLPLSPDDLAITASAYGWIQAHNLWAYTSFYLEHNQRVRQFLQPTFTPFGSLWAELALE